MYHRPRQFLVVTCVTISSIFVAAVLILSFQMTSNAAPLSQTEPAIIVGAGDISNCSNTEDTYTAYLMDSIDGTVVTLGDDAYEVGSLQEFNECYGPTWGRHLDRTRPTPGNHEYGTQGAEGYFSYYGDAATPLEPGCTRDCKGYYSYDLGAWHIVALNSEIENQAGSEQEQWLRADLAANPTACTLAYYHRPTFSSGRHGGGAAIDLYRALYDYGADVVLVGHDHNYERFAPQSPSALYEPERGIRQFVVGTGGATLRDFEFIQPNSEVRDHETWGVIKMTLHPDSYDWEFIPMPGQTFTDSGSSPCVSNPNLPPPPEFVATELEPVPAAESTVSTNEDTGADTTPAAATNTAPSATSTSTISGGKYIIQPGDTLFAVATRYDVQWTALADANNLTEDSILQIGQMMVVPGAGDEDSAEASTSTSTTESTSAAPISATAPVTSSVPTTTTAPSTSATGSATKPSTSTGSSSGDTVTVASGDTIISIALANDVGWKELLEVNGLEDDSIIQIGQELELP